MLNFDPSHHVNFKHLPETDRDGLDVGGSGELVGGANGSGELVGGANGSGLAEVITASCSHLVMSLHHYSLHHPHV